jgi:hypothetical protein
MYPMSVYLFAPAPYRFPGSPLSNTSVNQFPLSLGSFRSLKTKAGASGPRFSLVCDRVELLFRSTLCAKTKGQSSVVIALKSRLSKSNGSGRSFGGLGT